jgi:hypothetical protein
LFDLQESDLFDESEKQKQRAVSQQWQELEGSTEGRKTKVVVDRMY